MKEKVISIIKRFEAGEIDFDHTKDFLLELTGKEIDQGHLENYWRSESMEDFAEVMATPPLEDWKSITNEFAKELINEALDELGGAIFGRNGEALEKRYRKSSGFFLDLVFYDDLNDADLILKRLLEDTVIRL